MNLMFYSLLVFFAFSKVNGEKGHGKLKICIPKKPKNENTDSVQEKIPFGEEFREIIGSLPIQLHGDDPINFSLDNDVIRAKGYIKNVNVVGDSLTISVCKGTIPIPTSIILKELVIHGDEYYLNGTVADIFYIFGKGTLDLTIQDLTLGIINIGIDFSEIGCFWMDINLKLGGWKIYLKGLMDGDDLLEPTINDIMGDMGPDIVDYLWNFAYDQLVPKIQKIIDKYINHRDHLGILDNVILKDDHSKNLDADNCKSYIINI